MRQKILLGMLIYLIIYSIAQATAFNNIYIATVHHVYDGDTVNLAVTTWPDSVQYVRLRIAGMDTPEISRATACEKRLGIKAKFFLIDLLANNHITISKIKNDKYGGRVVGELFVDGLLVSEIMIAAGIAVPYFGKKKTKVWC